MVVVPDATHGLLKAGPYDYQLVEHWPWWTKLRFAIEGRDAYAPGSVERIGSWIGEGTN